MSNEKLEYSKHDYFHPENDIPNRQVSAQATLHFHLLSLVSKPKWLSLPNTWPDSPCTCVNLSKGAHTAPFGKDPQRFMTHTMKNHPLSICSKLILLTLFDAPGSCVGRDGGCLLPIHPLQATQDVLTLHHIPNFLF